MVIPKQADIYPNRSIAYLNLLPKNAVGVELGVCRGENASDILVASNPKKLYLVDTWDNKHALGWDGDPVQHMVNQSYRNHFKSIGCNYQNHVCSLFSKQIEEGTVEVIKNDASAFLHTVEDNFFDWVFIDTSHHYEETFQTLSNAIEKTKIGGIIGMHDFFVCLNEWDVITPVMHFIYERKIKLVAMCGERQSPSVFLQKTE